MRHGAAATILAIGLALGGVELLAANPSTVPDGPPELVSPYRQYDLKLRAFSPAPRCPAGVLLEVRINGAKPLRMVLDSGAESIVIGAKAARSVGVAAQSEFELVGLASRPAKLGRAQTVAVGPVAFRNCRVAVVDGKVVEGADGVIPLSFFSDFRLRLDLPEETLQLTPYPREDRPAVALNPGATNHHPLLLPTVLNGKQGGFVVLDTGAYCSAVSREVARSLGGFPLVREVRLAAGTGAASGQRVPSAVHFTIAGQDFVPEDVVAVDLSPVSRRCGVEVLGILGFPELSNFALTIDYRSGQVKIEPPQGVSARKPARAHHPEPASPLAFR